MLPKPYDPIVITRRSSSPGPTIALVAGIHGDEFYGTAALLRLAMRLKSVETRGHLKLVVAAHPFALTERTRSSSRIRGDLNRQFGRSVHRADTRLHKMAHELWNTHLADAEILVDIHSGGEHAMLPHARFSGKPESVLSLIRALGLRYAMKYRSFPPGILISKARQNCALAIGLEIGAGSELHPPTVKTLSDGLWNLLAYLVVVPPGGPPEETPQPTVVRPGYKQRANCPGFFLPSVSVGDTPSRGEHIGDFTSFLSLRSWPVVALRTGTVFSLLTSGPTSKGTKLVELVTSSDILPSS